MSTQIRTTRRAAIITGLAGLASFPAHSAFAADSFVVKDLREVDTKVVRFIAAQGTERMPNIALFGGSKEIWPKIKGAAEQAAAQGCPVRAILVGPIGAPRALEIYAKGQLVSRPIDPVAILQERLVLLLRNTKRDFY